jgi:hypothetical protein
LYCVTQAKAGVRRIAEIEKKAGLWYAGITGSGSFNQLTTQICASKYHLKFLLKFSAPEADCTYTNKKPVDVEYSCHYVRSLLTFTTKGPEAEIKAPEAGWRSQPASCIQASPVGQSPRWTNHRGKQKSRMHPGQPHSCPLLAPGSPFRRFNESSVYRPWNLRS